MLPHLFCKGFFRQFFPKFVNLTKLVKYDDCLIFQKNFYLAKKIF